MRFVGETAAILDPSGIISATNAFADGKNGKGILLLGLAFIPGGKRAEEAVWVYRIVKDGKVTYVGITSNLLLRERQHGVKLQALVKMGSRLDARAVEQALIQHHGLEKNGGTLINKINSISPKNPGFWDYVRMGVETLQGIGYFHP
jgi:hypothetical protein